MDLLGDCPERNRREAESAWQFVDWQLSGALSDETTILNFRHLLERDNLVQGLLAGSTRTWIRRDCG